MGIEMRTNLEGLSLAQLGGLQELRLYKYLTVDSWKESFAMNVLGVGTKTVTFAGKSSVYLRRLPDFENGAQDPNAESRELPDISFLEDWKEKTCHIECIAISKSDKLIAVGDSNHGLHLYEFGSSADSQKWTQILTCNSNKRIVKLMFTSDEQYITILDKQGDIFVKSVLEQSGGTASLKKILGHTSFISDYIPLPESKQIVSCDRDEKIRISNFPDAFIIQGFMLGHTESVMNVAVIPSVELSPLRQRHILSISVAGTLILWNFPETVDGTQTKYIKLWNVKELMANEVGEAEVKSMKVWVDEAQLLCSIVLVGHPKVYIFKISMSNLDIHLLQQLDMGSDLIITEWATTSATLISYTPQSGLVRLWRPEDGNSLSGQSFSNFPESMISDITALAETYKASAIPMKKRQTAFEDNLHVYKDKMKKVKT